MSSPGSRRSYLAALGAGIAVIAASTYGVSLTRAAQDVSTAGASSTIVASAVPVTSPSMAGASTSPAAPSSAPTSSSAPAAEPSTSRSTSPTRTAASSSRSGSGPSSTSDRSAATPTTSAAPTTTAAPTTSAAPPAPTTQAAPPTEPAPATSSAAPAPAATQFKDGTYSATAEYNSPGGVEKVGVTVMLAGDVVTGSSLELFGTGIAKAYQTLFQQNYAAQVNGKKIDSLQLGAVGGSSLTSGGFNAAINAIEEQAHA